MLRFLARLLGLVLLAAGFVGLVVDGTRSIANGALSFTALGEVGYRLFGERYLLLQPTVEKVHPFLWNSIVLNLLLAPAALFAFMLGVVLLWLGRKPEEPIGYATRR
jgi:uncharacterized iron-regulated membrane protein